MVFLMKLSTANSGEFNPITSPPSPPLLKERRTGGEVNGLNNH